MPPATALAATKKTTTGPSLPVDMGFVPAKVPGIRKAAILIIALDSDVATAILQTLNSRDVERITAEITQMGAVPPTLLRQVLLEFYGLLETHQSMVRGGPDYALRVLTEAFGAVRAEAFLGQVHKLQEKTTGDLAVLQEMDPQQLSKFLENEHPQTVALVLAHMIPEKGSNMLMSLKPALRVETVRRLAEMRQFSPEMAQKVALVLSRRMDAVGSSGRQSYSGVKSVADLLNRLDQSDSKSILEEIEQTEPKLAIGIRDLMFTFDDLLTIPQASVREIIGAADKRILAVALKGSRENMRAHMFKAMSSRAMEMLMEDMESLGPLRNKDVANAQQELLSVARKLESEGKLALKSEGDDEYIF